MVTCWAVIRIPVLRVIKVKADYHGQVLHLINYALPFGCEDKIPVYCCSYL